MTSTLMCLSLLVFHEGRGENLRGQEAIIEVVMNRTRDKRFPDTPCKVINQKSQFSWTSNPKNLKPPKYETEAWEKSQKVVVDYLSKRNKGICSNHTKGALYFNHKSLGVRFGKKLKAKYGSHLFF